MKTLLLFLTLALVGCASQNNKQEIYMIDAEVSTNGEVDAKPRIVVLKGESASVFMHSKERDMLLEMKVESTRNNEFHVEASYCDNVDEIEDVELSDLKSCSKIESLTVKSKEGEAILSTNLNNELKKKLKLKIRKVKKEETENLKGY